MKMIIVTQCCCGCTVRTGSLIIGILCAMSALLDLIYGIIYINAPMDDKEEAESIMTTGELYAYIFLSVITLAACAPLIYGVLKEHLKCIAVWMIVYSVYLVIILFYILQVVIDVIVHTEHVQLLWEIPALLVVLAIDSYCLVVVNSHYRNLKDGVTLPPRPPLIITV